MTGKEKRISWLNFNGKPHEQRRVYAQSCIQNVTI